MLLTDKYAGKIYGTIITALLSKDIIPDGVTLKV